MKLFDFFSNIFGFLFRKNNSGQATNHINADEIDYDTQNRPQEIVEAEAKISSNAVGSSDNAEPQPQASFAAPNRAGTITGNAAGTAEIDNTEGSSPSYDGFPIDDGSGSYGGFPTYGGFPVSHDPSMPDTTGGSDGVNGGVSEPEGSDNSYDGFPIDDGSGSYGGFPVDDGSGSYDGFPIDDGSGSYDGFPVSHDPSMPDTTGGSDGVNGGSPSYDGFPIDDGSGSYGGFPTYSGFPENSSYDAYPTDGSDSEDGGVVSANFDESNKSNNDGGWAEISDNPQDLAGGAATSEGAGHETGSNTPRESDTTS